MKGRTKETLLMVPQVVLGESSSKIEVKKSIFIATVRETHTEAEALAFLEEMRKKFWDARHNCHAFIVGARGEIRRFSDDKEPQGTAGKPILEAISSRGFQNTAVVVTRYFGGVLLGTNERVRAEVSGWFVNQKGLTYGGIQETDSGDWIEPDLIAAVGVDGTEGFVYASELADAQMLGMTVNNPEEAAAYMKQLKQERELAKAENRPYLRYIPLYESDGVTMIGEFGVGSADQVWVEWKDAQGE